MKIIKLLLCSLLFIGCSINPDMEGIILEVKEDQLLLAREITLSEYEQIKDKSALQIQNEDVLGDAYFGLIELTYKNAKEFNKGDQVEVWIDGEVMESYPEQAKAKKIKQKE